MTMMPVTELTTNWRRTQAFVMGRAAATESRWLTGDHLAGIYFEEYLPACFDRKLELDAFDLGEGDFEWILTGEEGGLTVIVDGSQVRLQQRYFGSFGAYDAKRLGDADPESSLSRWFEVPMSHVVSGRSVLGTYPEKPWFRSEADWREPIESLRLTVDHTMIARLEVNGQPVLAQRLDFDFHQHQLRLGSAKAEVCGRLLTPSPLDVTVRVDPKHTHQTMIGFGGTAAPPAFAELSEPGRERWWELMRNYNLLIQRDNPIGHKLDRDMTHWDHLDKATPHYYGDNFPNGNLTDFDYNRRMQQLGGEVWFEFWDFPVWVYDDPDTPTTDEKGLARRGKVNVQRYAEAIVGYCRTAEQRTGRAPAVVGIQNEQGHASETYHAMTRTLRRALDEAGYASVRIHMSDANMLTPESTWGTLYSDSLTRARTFTQDPEVFAAIDYAAAHMYDVQEFFGDPDSVDPHMDELRKTIGDKPFLSSELCLNSPRFQQRTYRLALLMAEMIHKNLTRLDAAAVLYCWTLVNVTQPSFGWTRSLFVADRANGFMPVASGYMLRLFGAFSRYIERGMQRVGCAVDHPDVLVSAYSDGAERATVVLLNRSTKPVRVRLDWPGVDLTHAEVSDPYQSNAASPKAVAEPVLAPGSLVTLTSMAPRPSIAY